MKLELGPRLNLLTGDNGVGKTFLLDVAWWALTGDWGSLPANPNPDAMQHRIEYHMASDNGDIPVYGRYDYGNQAWHSEDHPPQGPGRLVLYAHVDGSFSVWDSVRNGFPSTETKRILRVPDPPYHFSPVTLWEGLRTEDQVFCEGLIRDWVSWQLQETEAFRQLTDVLRTLSPGDEELLRPGRPARVSLKDIRNHPTLEMPYGTVPLIFASAGMKRIIGLAYLLVWAWQEHLRASELLRQSPANRVVFLVDEAEAHLHPKWQRLILPALVTVMERLQKKAKVQILATTHAPLILASVEPLFHEPDDRLVHLCLEVSRVKVEEIHWSKQGDAVNWLVSDVFGLRQARSKEAERAIEAAEAWMRGDVSSLPSDLATREAIHEELQRVLAGHDEFWPRWIVSAEPTQKVGSRGR